MYKVIDISDKQLIQLKSILNDSKPPIGQHLETIKAAPGIGNNKSTQFDSSLLTLIPLGLANNIKLLEWLEIFTGISSKYITNIHLNDMKEGAYFNPHYDNYHIKVSDTYTFLLEEPKQGGDFILDGRTMTCNKNKVVIFNGGKYLHGVSKVKKGTRKSFIVFYNQPTNKESKLLL